jgi:hypothetical protein
MFRQRIWQGASSSQIPGHNSDGWLWQGNIVATDTFYLLVARAQTLCILRIVIGELARPMHAA